MSRVEYKDLLDAGVHFGHLTRKWHPKMAPYIFMERNGIHIIDLNKTKASLEIVCEQLKGMAKSGRKIMFVATKKQAKEVVAEAAVSVKMPFVTERWLGGMLTNFSTVRKSLKKMSSIEKLMKDDRFKYLAKRERLMKQREKDKLFRVLGGISDQSRLPAALFIIDIKKEHIAVKEAKKLGIPVYGVVDTNSDPNLVDFAIPANDDAFKSVKLITSIVTKAIEEGLTERKQDREEAKRNAEEEKKKAVDAPKVEAPVAETPAVETPAKETPASSDEASAE